MIASLIKPKKAVPPGRGTQRLFGFFLLVFSLLVFSYPAQAQTQDGDTQNLIRSAMVYNFCKFVQWPEGSQGDSIVLGIVGEQLSAADFHSIQGKTVRDVPITIRVINTTQDLADCNLVFIGKDQSQEFSTTLAVAQAESILTISDIDGFCRDGGIIQLVERRGKLRFFINRQAADEAHLSMSSQLLKVARVVEGG